jgi:TolB-like protein
MKKKRIMGVHDLNLSLWVWLKRFYESHGPEKKNFPEGIVSAIFQCTVFLSVILLLFSLEACGSLSPGAGRMVIPRSDRSGLAVLNLKNATPRDHAAQFQPWEYGIATMLTTDLEAIGIFNVVERERLIDIARELNLQKTDLVDKDTAVAVGKMTAAQYILTGSFTEMNGQLRIAVQIFSVEQGIQLGAASMTGKTDEFFLLEKRLFVKVTEFLEVMLSEENKEKIMKNIETESVGASLRNYSGEMAVAKAELMKKAGRNDEAIRLLRDARKEFAEALVYDPNYIRAKKNLATLTRAIPKTL